MSLIGSISGLGSSLFTGANPQEKTNPTAAAGVGQQFSGLQADALERIKSAKNIEGLTPAEGPGLESSFPYAEGAAPVGLGSNAPSFGEMLEGLVESVDGKNKMAQDQVQKIMTGESDNLHQTMIAMQEAGTAFTLLVEVRNKLTESYQQLMRMSV